MPGTMLGTGVRKEQGGVRAEGRRLPTPDPPCYYLSGWVCSHSSHLLGFPVTMTGTWIAKELTRKIKLGAKTSLVNAAWMRKHGL